jgi:hypothetical protein
MSSAEVDDEDACLSLAVRHLFAMYDLVVKSVSVKTVSRSCDLLTKRVVSFLHSLRICTSCTFHNAKRYLSLLRTRELCTLIIDAG